MAERRRTDFCIECRNETEYVLQKRRIVRMIRDREYSFEITMGMFAMWGGDEHSRAY